LGAFAIISLIISIIRAIPDFIALVKYILNMIRKGAPLKRAERRQRLLQLLKEARASHDYSTLGVKLEAMKAELEMEMAESSN
jgi:hypothetical protein